MSTGRVPRRRSRCGPGRPSKLTPDIKARIFNTVRCGGSYRMAVMAAGIGETTLYKWKSKGEDPEAPADYRQFLEELKQAEAEGNALRVAQIQKAAATDWRAGAWLLERRLPHLFSVRYQIEQAREPEDPFAVLRKLLPPRPRQVLAEPPRPAIGLGDRPADPDGDGGV